MGPLFSARTGPIQTTDVSTCRDVRPSGPTCDGRGGRRNHRKETLSATWARRPGVKGMGVDGGSMGGGLRP